MSDIVQDATDIANAIEQICDGYQGASVIYALGMVMATGVLSQKKPDLDGAMTVYRRIVGDEISRRRPV